jgi:uncharacterized membrane protein
MKNDAYESGLKLLAGVGLGAALMFFLDPARGRRRRGLVRDQVVHGLNAAEESLGSTARDLRNRAGGLVAEARSRARGRAASDEVLVERVRTKLGRVASHPRAISVAARDGRVFLSGPIMASEVDDVVSAVRSVRGVTDVENELDVYADAGDVSALQGRRRRPRRKSALGSERWTPTARVVAGATGSALAVYGARRKDALGVALGVAGLALAMRGATNLEMRRLLGAERGRRAVEFHKTININVPIEQAFTFFTDFENYPRFMSHVREVRDLGGGRTHWVVDGPAGSVVEWDAVVTSLVPNERLAWQSVEGSPVQHQGVMSFERRADGGTRVDIRMGYNPPGGAVGHALAIVFRTDPKRQMSDDLLRAKTTLETGTPSHDASQGSDAPGEA